MKKYRISIVVALLVLGVAFVSIAAIPGMANLGEIGGCANSVNKVNAPKLARLLSAEVGTSRDIHGVAGLLRLGVMSGSVGSELCTGSDTQSCKTLTKVELAAGGTKSTITKTPIKIIRPITPPADPVEGK